MAYVAGVFIIKKGVFQMEKQSELYRKMTQKKYEMEEKEAEFLQTQEAYREGFVEDSVESVLMLLKEEETITKRDLKLLLGDLSLKTKHLYSK